MCKRIGEEEYKAISTYLKTWPQEIVCWAWGKFRELSGILTRKDVPLKLKEKVYMTCMKSAVVYGSETWDMNV